MGSTWAQITKGLSSIPVIIIIISSLSLFLSLFAFFTLDGRRANEGCVWDILAYAGGFLSIGRSLWRFYRVEPWLRIFMTLHR